MSFADMDFFTHLSLIEDPRSHVNRQHNLVDIMFLVMAAVVSGCEGWQEIEDFGVNKLDWLRKYRPFDNGIPTRHSIARIVKGIKIEVLVESLFSWVNAKRESEGQPIIAFDGKTLRGIVNQQGKGKALHLVSAFDTGEGLVLCQQSTKQKSEEIDTVRQLLDCLEIKGAIVTMDALHCQKKTLKQITEKGADFVIQVKKNQPKLLTAIQQQFEPYWACDGEGLTSHSTRDDNHGRREERTVFQMVSALPDEISSLWPDIKSVIAVERSRSQKGKGTLDTHYYVSSLDVDPELAGKAVRQHWHIENQQHWVLDVTYREDASRLGDREAAEVFALLRRVALNMAQHHPKSISKRRKIKCSCWSDDFRMEMFFGVESGDKRQNEKV